jgi:succinate dehydrogenase/fumarate reductase flavoprotein subunit
MDSNVFDVDLLVIGAGIAGMTLAATAAQDGLSVAVIEISSAIGGSAALSEGYVWTAPNTDVFREQDETGNLEKFEIMLNALPEAFQWLESQGIEVGATIKQVLGYGEGRQIDIPAFFHKTKLSVESNGIILLNTEVEELLDDGAKIIGASFKENSTGEQGTIKAAHTVIATGGFQANPNLLNELLFPGAGDLTLRSNTDSKGGGIQLGREVGVELTEDTHAFYGHLVPYPLKDFQPKEFALLAQYFSDHALIFDKHGKRFTDESLGDHINTNVIAKLGPVLLFVDGRVTRDQVTRAFIPGMDAINKMETAGLRGANYFSSDTLENLCPVIESWGYDSKSFLTSILDYNSAIEEDREMNPPRTSNREQLIEPPFAVLEIQAAITFTYKGLLTNSDGQAIANGKPKEGLWIVGVDAGGLNQWGYTGGLVRGLTLGRRTAKIISAKIEKVNQ